MGQLDFVTRFGGKQKRDAMDASRWECLRRLEMRLDVGEGLIKLFLIIKTGEKSELIYEGELEDGFLNVPVICEGDGRHSTIYNEAPTDPSKIRVLDVAEEPKRLVAARAECRQHCVQENLRTRSLFKSGCKFGVNRTPGVTFSTRFHYLHVVFLL